MLEPLKKNSKADLSVVSRLLGKKGFLKAKPAPASIGQTVTRLFLGGAMTYAGIAHLTVAREEFQAQVPGWFPLDDDFVVLASGFAEIGLGVALLALPKQKRLVGLALAGFYVVIFPGNIAQYLEGKDGFGLDTDTKRLVRLFFQPPLVLAALYAGDIIGGKKEQ